MIDVKTQNRTKPVLKLNPGTETKQFLPLPKPSGAYPYRLKLDAVTPEISSQKLVFHLVGDTGSVVDPSYQKYVVREMNTHFSKDKLTADQPAFLYHVGDVVYNFGEAEHYYQQFFNPYRNYPKPIFAIAGNHDGDVNFIRENPPKSLEAFTNVFCDIQQRDLDLAGDSGRKSMIQPNVYWTLVTPLANFIGLYCNVTKFGIITEEQRLWFINELKDAARQRPEKALIVTLHHSPYSCDTNHGSSLNMIDFLEKASEESGVKPDIVFSGHVHNYQRFHREYPDGTTIPFIVAGAGGYVDLHKIAENDDPEFPDENEAFNDVTLQSFCTDGHGFLKLEIEKQDSSLTLTGTYFKVNYLDEDSDPTDRSEIYDTFQIST
ncbi:MAG: metallophosphoesterase [Daejeonella sp.]|nr:metallophosphoesterase [Daejeonella sp.]